MRLIPLVVTLGSSILVSQSACDPVEVGDDDIAVDASALAVGDVVVELALEKTRFGANDPVTAVVTLTNLSSRSVRLLSWRLPDADLEEPVFTVTRDGQPSAYLGRHFKRSRPTDADYVTVRAGDSLVRKVDLARFYDFAKSGHYQIRIDIPVSDDRSGHLSAKGAGAWVDKHEAPQSDAVAVSAAIGPISFSHCDATQQAAVVAAAGAANTMSDDALAFLTTAADTAPRYTRWFGAYTATRRAAVKQHFSSIADAFDTKSMTIDCGCKKKNYYAYVYSNKPYTIYLCKAFWSAPTSGWDSKGGTLVHEMSHFDVVAATDDWTYGRTACEALAASNPDAAIDNADNHEYFAEQP